MIVSDDAGCYIPISLDETQFTIEELKEERAFLQFIMDLSYNDNKNFRYVQRLFSLEMREDPKFRRISHNGKENLGAKLWMAHLADIKTLKDRVSLEIMRRSREGRHGRV